MFYLENLPYQQGEAALKSLWLDHITEAGEYQPRDKTSGFRIVSYNLNKFQNLYGEPGRRSQFRFLLKTDADVICLQECVALSHFKDKYKQLLADYPYYQMVNLDPNQGMGNVILSRVPIKDAIDFVFHGARDFRGVCKVTVEIGKEEVDIWNTHLDKEDLTGSIRQEQLEEILRCSDPKKRNIICGGLNALDHIAYDETEWQWLQQNKALHGQFTPQIEIETLRQAGYQTGFDLNDEHNPKVTCWSGRSVDHIFLSHFSKEDIIQNQVVMTDHSDHALVLVDIEL